MSNILSTFFPPASGESPTPVVEDCASCRLIGGMTAFGLSAYALNLARQAPKQAALLSPRGRFLLGGLAMSFASMGFGRLAGLRLDDQGGLTTVIQLEREHAGAAVEKPAQV